MLDPTEQLTEQVRPGPDWTPWHCGRPRCPNVIGWVRGAELVVNDACTRLHLRSGPWTWVLCNCGQRNDWHHSDAPAPCPNCASPGR
jgi:hypothetical protein